MISKVSLRLFEKFEVFEKRPSVIAPHGSVKKTFVCLTVVRYCDLVPFPLPFSVMKAMKEIKVASPAKFDRPSNWTGQVGG